MIKLGVVGLGKMGLSHLSIFRAHPDVEVVGVCDSTGYVLDVLGKYTGVRDLQGPRRDAARRASPTRSSSRPRRTCTRPWCARRSRRGCTSSARSPSPSTTPTARSSPSWPRERGLVTQVGYHNRFVGAFGELKRLLDAGALGRVTHVLAEAYGPVVLAPKGGTWRVPAVRRRRLPLRLRRAPARPRPVVPRRAARACWAAGSTRIFSAETDDEVVTHARLPRRRHRPGVGQLVRRVAAQDDDQDQHLGHRRPRVRRPAGGAGLPARHASRRPRATGTAGTSTTRPTSPSSRGSTCAARSTAPRPTSSSTGSRRAAPRARTPSRPPLATDRILSDDHRRRGRVAPAADRREPAPSGAAATAPTAARATGRLSWRRRRTA